MRDIAFIFFLAAVVCVTSGMVWGIQMAISEDHLLAPAHAHLNLVGWTTLALFGLYYRLTPTAARGSFPAFTPDLPSSVSLSWSQVLPWSWPEVRPLWRVPARY
ncbi:hypothetical protein U8P75_36830 (plasmid) [Rhizobium beringeri]|nr:hypothetical protein U8P75_36830 [Rhizobium beringeri]